MHTPYNSAAVHKGTWFAILSGLLYGLLGYFGVNLLDLGFSAYCLGFWRFAISCIFLLVWIFAQGVYNFGGKRERWFTLLNGAIFYGAPSTLFFLSCRYIGTGQAMVIFFLYPVFVMLLNRIFAGTPIKPHYFAALILIFAGLVLLLDVGKVNIDAIGIGLSMASAVTYAIYVFLSKKVPMPPISGSLMVSLGCAFSSLSLTLIDDSFLWPTQAEQWLFLCAIGIVCSALPILLLLEALKHISSDKASLLSVLEPLATVVVGVLLLGEVLTFKKIVGIAITLMGVMAVMMKWPIKRSLLFK